MSSRAFSRAVTGGTGNWGWVSAWAVTGGTGVNGLKHMQMFLILIIATSKNLLMPPCPFHCWKMAKCIHLFAQSVLTTFQRAGVRGAMCESRSVSTIITMMGLVRVRIFSGTTH